MIQKLRRKFILINMLLVSLVLLIVFAVLCFSSHQRLKQESNHAIYQALQRSKQGKEPDKPVIDGKRPPKQPWLTPVFCVVLNPFGEIQSIEKENVEISDEIVKQVVDQAISSNKTEGILYSLNIRYRMEQNEQDIRIAFADITNEKDSMTDLVFSSIVVGGGGLTAFFFISLYLSRWVLRPVESAWKQQRQFVADASHELKTPVTVILANLDILTAHRKETIEAEIKWIDYMKEEASRMKKLIDDLLFLAKSDNASMETQMEKIHFSDLVLGCILPFESLVFEQGILLDSQIDPDLMIYGNEGQLKQLILILLDNACKYSIKNGTVTLRLKENQDSIQMKVQNWGIPISKEDQKHLFERFYRADKSRSREQGGYGLGLAIAKSIVERHNGKISVESNEKQGTVFTVEFISIRTGVL